VSALDLEPPFTFGVTGVGRGRTCALDASDVATAIRTEAPDRFNADPVNIHPPSELPRKVFELAMVQIVKRVRLGRPGRASHGDESMHPGIAPTRRLPIPAPRDLPGALVRQSIQRACRFGKRRYD
jgi:hypothetical protein